MKISACKIEHLVLFVIQLSEKKLTLVKIEIKIGVQPPNFVVLI